MEEDTEYKKLPVEDRCVHKLWKARVDGYEEAAKIFREIDDEKSPEWNKFVGLVKKFIVDTNAMAQEKGLEATLIFVENCAHAGKTVGDVMSGIVQKCIAAPKTKTKDLAVQVTLMYVEVEKQEAVAEELIKGMDHKNPKIVAACVSAVTLALREFGSKVISVKPLIKKLAPLMSDRDKAVREEGKQLAIEIYRWIGPAMKPQIATLPQVTLTELENEFEKLKGEKPEPTRYLKSQQEKQQQVLASAVDDDGAAGDDDDVVDAEEVDPMDLLDPVDILSKLPKDFYEKLEAKKWQERKESLEALEKLLENPKLEGGDYGDVVRALKKVLTKDTNVMLVAMSGKCLASLAKGLGKRFQPYATACIPAIFEKFKEKKANVVSALRDAADAIYPSTSLEAFQEDLLEALGNKNPNVKAETASFLARAFTRTQPAMLNKKLLKPVVTALLKTLNESDPTVRDSSADALGTLLKLMGEKVVGPFLVDVDALKMAKIKECQEKAVIVVKVAGAKKERPATAPPKSALTQTSSETKGGSTEPKPVTRPSTAGGRKPVVKKGPAAGGGGIAKSASSSKVVNSERELTPEEVAARAEEILSPDILSGLSDVNWKTRLASVESFLNVVNELDPKCGHAQILARTLSSRKPGLKDTNFQVLKVKLDSVRIMAERLSFTLTTADFLVNDVTEKLADPKNGGVAAQVLTAIAEATKLEPIASKVMSFAFEQKSPKVQSESLNWVNQAIREFGFQINPKVLLDDVKKGVQSTNPTVRSSAITLIGTMSMFMGNNLMMFFDSEKPALKQQIQAEFDKNAGQKPPAPIRGVKKVASSSSLNDDDDGGGGDDDAQEAINVADLLPRIDISSQITEFLLTEIADKNWKTRNEGLTKLQNVITEAKLIKPAIGDLPQALAQRLVDSNAKIAQTAIAICEQLANAMGPACKTHIRTLFPGFLHGLGDSKVFIRAASLSCINTWGEQCGFKEFFDGEMIADSLKTGSPALRTELWGWMAEKLPGLPPKSIPKEELVAVLPYLYANISDRSADVRKNANEAVLGIMIHLSYESMMKALDKQKPSSKKDIQAALDKARPNLPIKPLPKSKQQAPIEESKPTKVVTGRAQKQAAASSKTTEKPSSSRKKEEEVDTSPLLAVNNIKNQRLIDEQKLRVLKWTFTTPREEFIDLLRDQMTTANVNKGLMANMFHDDFRYHLKVIDALIEDLPNNSKALIANLDLILKWISLRFYDTNPSVLLKALDYLNMVFQVLVENEYILAENEGSAFIPHLLIKIGDPKDAVRNGVRTLIRQLCLIYPYTKMFAYIMEGLKSKNARQRTECLDELGYLIETYGLSVCQPTQQAALKEIARHISDRDNSVRSAALNSVVQAYFLAGERVYKLIGQLSEKDLSMLDERIKRAKKTKKPTPIVEVAKATTTTANIPTDNIEIEETANEELPSEDGGSPVVTSSLNTLDAQNSVEVKEMPSKTPYVSKTDYTLKRQATFDQPQPQIIQPRITGPFRLDPEVVANIEKDWVRSDQMKEVQITPVDLSFMNAPLKIVTRDGYGYPRAKLDELISRSAKMPVPAHYNNNFTMSPPQPASNNLNSTAAVVSSTSSNLAETLPKLDPNLVKIVRAVGNLDSYTARAAMNEVADIIDSPEKQAVLRDYEELFVESILTQFKNLSHIPLSESLIMYQPLLSITYSFFNSKTLGKSLSIPTLKNVMSVLLGLMADQKLSSGEDGQYTKVVNGICLKILDKTNFTNLNCALIRLLKETCPQAGLPKFTDLLMKCIWRNVKVMPERSNELDYDAVLYEVHEFMLTLPSVWWGQRPSDTPLRTVKTIIHNMAKIKGNAILQHLNKIPKHSELHAYLIRILKNLQKDANGQTSASPARSSSGKDQSKKMSNQTQEAMSQIFKLISDKETSKLGLAKLYDFKTTNPDVEVAPFLKGASPNFQKYIEDGLAEIERQRYQEEEAGGDNKCEDSNFVSSSTTTRPVNKQDAEYWLEKLNAMRGNISPSRSQEIRNMADNKVTDENLNLNQLPQKVSSMIRKDKAELSPHRLEHLQQKLAQIKQQRPS